MSSGTSKYSTDNYEYFKNVEEISNKPDKIKAYIPKFMPNIKGGNWTRKYPINNNLLLNSPECSVVIPSIVIEQGFYTISRYDNEIPDFKSKAISVGTDKDGNSIYKVKAGNIFMAEVLHEDTSNIHFTGKV